jgi:hypothetical protein
VAVDDIAYMNCALPSPQETCADPTPFQCNNKVGTEGTERQKTSVSDPDPESVKSAKIEGENEASKFRSFIQV